MMVVCVPAPGLYHEPEDRDYTYGFVYIDPEAGFTVQYGGRFTIDATGNMLSHLIQFLPTK